MPLGRGRPPHIHIVPPHRIPGKSSFHHTQFTFIFAIPLPLVVTDAGFIIGPPVCFGTASRAELALLAHQRIVTHNALTAVFVVALRGKDDFKLFFAIFNRKINDTRLSSGIRVMMGTGVASQLYIGTNLTI